MTMKGVRWLAAASCVALGCTSPEEHRAIVAEQTYDRYCSACHGLAETGPEPVPGLGFIATDLRELGAKYGTPLPREQLSGFIDGRHDLETGAERLMPVWGEQLYDHLPDTTGRDEMRLGTIDLLLDYLDSIQPQP